MKFLKETSTFLALFLLVPIFTLRAQKKEKPSTLVSFKKVQLLNKYVSEGASIADINTDGHLDIIAGSLWWEGPAFKQANAYAPVKYFPITGPGIEGYSTNFFTFPIHIDGNHWIDIIQVGMPGTDSKWVQDPGKISLPISDIHLPPQYLSGMPNVCHESPVLLNIIGDENKELLAFSKGRLVLGIPPKSKTDKWLSVPISKIDPDRFPVYSHGLGAGDINGDGLVDIIEKTGWWEQPANWNQASPWNYHFYPFSSKRGGAQMYAFDIDGDGDNDVVTSLDGHGYGLSWHEQLEINSAITFKEHIIMTDSPEGNLYGVSFSQLHALSVADMDNDGIQDVITGKCFYAHNGRDPGAEDPSVLYWFKTLRHSDGSVEFIPHMIDNISGVGRQFSTADINNDGKVDVVTSNKKGVFAFIQN